MIRRWVDRYKAHLEDQHRRKVVMHIARQRAAALKKEGTPDG